MRSLIVLSVVIVLSLSILSLSQETIGRSEVLDIVDQLIQQQRTSWIRTGTMEVRHTEYRAPIITDAVALEARIQQALADFDGNPGKIVKTEHLQAQKREAIPFNTRYEYANETSTTTRERVKVDQGRHCQDISIESRTESVTKPASLAYNQMTDDIDLYGNQRRMFAWDGQNYSLYNLPINVAIVDASNRFSQAGIAALKAGLIPWGQGMFSKDKLAAAQITGQTNQNSKIVLSFIWDTGVEFTATLDAKRSFSLTSHSLVRSDGSISTTGLSNHHQVEGSWIPHKIMTERFDAQAQRRLGYDRWEIIAISMEPPLPSDFAPEYDEEAFVSYYSPLSDRPLRYHHNSRADTHDLLSRRLNALASANNGVQNCATLSIAYAAEKLGTPFLDPQLNGMVDASGYTSLLQMKSTARSMGLNAELVRTDAPGLARYAGSQIILHIPDKNHFIILGHVGSEDVWCIDISKNRFYYPTNIDLFSANWSEGTALILSNSPIVVSKPDQVLTDAQANAITGGSGYTCTQVAQEASIQYCLQDGECTACYGWFRWFFRVMQCESAPTGWCDDSNSYIRTWSTACTNDLCDCVAVTWYYSYMSGCP